MFYLKKKNKMCSKVKYNSVVNNLKIINYH